MSPAEVQAGIARLSRGTYFQEASLDMTLSVLTQAAGELSGVERTSIWALTDNQEEMRCLELFERSKGRHSSGGVVSGQRYPAYFQALGREEAIVADDPYLHPDTMDLSADYLPSHGITALLTAPIHIRGEWQGVLCLEQVGSRLPWTTVHRLLAQSVANLVTLALVEFEAAEARRQARRASDRLRAVFEASRDALILADGETGVVLDANRQAELLFGCQRIELIGRHQRQLHPEELAESCARDFRDAVSGGERQPVVTWIRRKDGTTMAVEIYSEVADTEGSASMILGVFRPVAETV